VTTNYLHDLFSLQGRTALVTGGSSGIGLAIATALGRAGARVVIAARGEDALHASVTRMQGQGVEASYVAADLSVREGVDRLCQDVTGQVGDLDVLVNSAGVNIRPPMGELTDAEWSTTIAVNQTAPFLLGQYFGPLMAARGWGRIINIGSQQAVRAFGNSGAYGIAKAAVTGLTRSQSEAWAASGVCANTIVPGFVVTPMTLETIAESGREEALAARSMIGRNGLPEDFAAAAVFLASPGAAYVTGTALFVDGGFSVH
jgi:NAD(P)-dependent dehydrogenase (short-subunit alcohol dehydrogenase family)